MCARYSLGDIDNVVHESGLSWDELVQISMRRVCWLPCSRVLAMQNLESILQSTTLLPNACFRHTEMTFWVLAKLLALKLAKINHYINLGHDNRF